MGSVVTVVTARVVKRCPFREETDRGTAIITFAGDATELHDLAAVLGFWSSDRISHEDYTRRLAEYTGAHVTTTWRTAGMEIACASI